MDQQKIEQYRQSLLDEKAGLERTIESIQGGGLAEPMQDAISELSSYDNHPADMGSEMFERSKDFSLRENARSRRGDVEAALLSIEKGNYGVCQKCGKEIPEDRLEAIPSTIFCFECKQEDEDLVDPQIRPVEENVLYPPFSRSYRDGTNENMYDGEDAWQEVAQYGTAESPSDYQEPGEFYIDNNLGGDRVVVTDDADEDRGSTEDVDDMAVEEDEAGIFSSTLHGKKK